MKKAKKFISELPEAISRKFGQFSAWTYDKIGLHNLHWAGLFLSLQIAACVFWFDQAVLTGSLWGLIASVVCPAGSIGIIWIGAQNNQIDKSEVKNFRNAFLYVVRPATVKFATVLLPLALYYIVVLFLYLRHWHINNSSLLKRIQSLVEIGGPVANIANPFIMFFAFCIQPTKKDRKKQMSGKPQLTYVTS